MEKVVAAVPPPEPEKKVVYMKGRGDSPGGLRLVFSIDENEVQVTPALLDVLAGYMAMILNVACYDTDLLVEMMDTFRQLNDYYTGKLIMRINPPVSIPEE